MARKARDFGALQAGIADLTEGKAEPTAQPVALATESSERRGKGRPPTDTSAMQLRLSRHLITALVKEAAEASIAEGRNVTPQQIIGRILEERYRG